MSWLALSPHTTIKSSWQGLCATEMTVNGTVAVLNLCTHGETHTCDQYRYDTSEEMHQCDEYADTCKL